MTGSIHENNYGKRLRFKVFLSLVLEECFGFFFHLSMYDFKLKKCFEFGRRNRLNAIQVN